MEKIKNISELPDWFHKRSYRKQLSDKDWYREIRWRQNLQSLVEMHGEALLNIGEESYEFLSKFLEKEDVRPDSMIYVVPGEGVPVLDLTVGETAFLAFSTQKSDVSAMVEKYIKLLELWREACDEMQAAGSSGPTPAFGQYEVELPAFLDQLEKDDPKFDCPIEQYSKCLMNPWLSYGRPLNGHPVTIDTQFDDETILHHVKKWLVEKRKTEGIKARRPFNQNDFDDWEYYKIREIFDLQMWATLNDKKILDRVLAEALWPNAPDDFSPIDTLRTTARKKTKDIFQFETVVRLYGQLQLAHGENFLIE